MVAQNKPHRHDWDPEGNCEICGKKRDKFYEELVEDEKAELKKYFKDLAEFEALLLKLKQGTKN